MKNIILRADGNGQIGLGHVYRLLALADILKNNFHCIFVINNPSAFLKKEIKKICAKCIVLKNNFIYSTPDEMKNGEEIKFDLGKLLKGNEIVVTDGYLFGKNYQLSVKSSGAKLVCIDDMANNEFYADIVINHAPGFDERKYNVQAHTSLFRGLDYSILRMPFFKPIKKKNVVKAFISLGGVDCFGYTEKLVDLLYDEFEELNIMMSSSFNPKLLNTLKKKSLSEQKLKLHINLKADDIVQVMDECSHSFVSASTILFESFARGLKCFTGFYTENQKFIYKGFISESKAIGLGNFSMINKKMIQNALKNENKLTVLRQPLNSYKNIQKIFKAL